MIRPTAGSAASDAEAAPATQDVSGGEEGNDGK
jgi:hypothetical protein